MKKRLLKLMLIVLSSMQLSVAEQQYPSYRPWLAASGTTAAAAAGVGYLAYRAAGRLTHLVLGSRTWMPMQVQERVSESWQQTITPKAALIAGCIGGGLAGLLAFDWGRRWLVPGLYMHWSRERLLPGAVNKALMVLDEYVMHLNILDNIEQEFNDLLGELNSQKYHQSNLAQRLKVLDGAYYHLKEFNLIAELEKERNFHIAQIRHALDGLGYYVEPYSEASEFATRITLRYQQCIKGERTCTREEALEYMQSNEKHTIYEALSEFYTHIKLFRKGFNEGINVIDEARKINLLARRLLDRISDNLADQYVLAQQTALDCKRLAHLEKWVRKPSTSK